MRKIEKDMVRAIREGENWNGGNTTVRHENGSFSVRLHGNEIAWGKADAAFRISSCGWMTNTTKSRLNAILDGLNRQCRVYQKKGDWFIWNHATTVHNGEFVDGMAIFPEVTRDRVIA